MTYCAFAHVLRIHTHRRTAGECDVGGAKGLARQSAAASFLPTHHMRTRKMRIAMFATSMWLTLLGTIALAQSMTYDCDRSASFSTYKTYAWTRGTELTDQLNHARVVRAIDAA